jgi:hypothetical protein
VADIDVRNIVENHRAGSSAVILQVPFKANNREIKAVVVGPFLLDHRLRWKEGEYGDWFKLMSEVCFDVNGDLLTADVLRQLRSPDDDKVMGLFFQMMPDEMKEARVKGQWPSKNGEELSFGEPGLPESTAINAGMRGGPSDEEVNVQEDKGLDIG